MTRKDYVAIARAIALVRGDCDGLVPLVEELCAIFKADNPRFDKDRFISACVQETS